MVPHFSVKYLGAAGLQPNIVDVKDRKDAVKANALLRVDSRYFCIYSHVPFCSSTCRTPVNLFG